MKLEHSLTPHTKINSEWIKDLNIRSETIKPLEENLGRALFDINCSNNFLAFSPKVKEIKPKINKWGLMKLKSFMNKMKRQPTEWEKIFTNHITYIGLMLNI